MRIVKATDAATGVTVVLQIATRELAALSGVELAAALFPDPTPADIADVNTFLDHYRSSET